MEGRVGWWWRKVVEAEVSVVALGEEAEGEDGVGVPLILVEENRRGIVVRRVWRRQLVIVRVMVRNMRRRR